VPAPAIIKGMFYHLVVPDSLSYVRKNGITADEEGYIYMLYTKSPEITDTVATNQLLVDTYYLFQIDPSSFESEVEPDRVAEFTARYHTRIKQREIEPYYIKELGKRKVDINRVQRFTEKELKKRLPNVKKDKDT
jgi:hypothetical protein